LSFLLEKARPEPAGKIARHIRALPRPSRLVFGRCAAPWAAAPRARRGTAIAMARAARRG